MEQPTLAKVANGLPLLGRRLLARTQNFGLWAQLDRLPRCLGALGTVTIYDHLRFSFPALAFHLLLTFFPFLLRPGKVSIRAAATAAALRTASAAKAAASRAHMAAGGGGSGRNLTVIKPETR
mmetsp:Transcript_17518/g.48399  ORF Transcript_17518/g.48399 Transcript_17518/m.48399 type:complete len:123 (-) Transcript_17518:154-522(-)